MSSLKMASSVVLFMTGWALLGYIFLIRPQMGRVDTLSGQPMLPREELLVGEARLQVEIADEPLERERGLSGRPGLARGTGMLFRFPEPIVQSFWMKDMRFPLDILYLSEGRVREVFANVPFPAPSGTPAIVLPTAPADAVLEVPAGEVARQGWGPGTRVSVP